MKQNLRVSLGAVVLALATLAAMIFALLNFDQRARYELAYDGVAWLDTDHGVQAKQVSPNSPATRAGIHANDVLLSINGAHVTRATEVARRLDRAGLWTQVRYKLSRNGEEFETPLVTAPAEKPLATENYLRVVGLLFLFIGLFIFARRWNAPRAVHFYVFCLVSFICWSFHYSGKFDAFDWEVYWSEIVALGNNDSFVLEAPGRVRAAPLFARNSCKHRAQRSRFRALACSLPLAHEVGIQLSGALFSGCRACFLLELPGSPVRCPSPAIKVAYWRNAHRHFAGLSVLHPSDGARCQHGSASLDEDVGVEPRADSAVFRLCHHSLPFDGRGYHLQARSGLHRGHSGCRHGLFCSGGPHYLYLPRADD